ncbi:MAG: hypothetical protein K0S34_2132 [Bacillales bacterium]|nr:hypothetical protein [Bacillales bacterium]
MLQEETQIIHSQLKAHGYDLSNQGVISNGGL